MVYKSLVAGSALLAVAGNALASKTYESKSTCSIKSISSASSVSQTVAAVAIDEVNAVLCSGGPDVYKSAYAAAQVSATAYATAMVDVTVDCYATGNAEYKVNGKSYAYAQATGIAKAFALAQANSKTCGKCSAAGKAIVSSFETIYLKATAQLEPYFHGTAGEADAKDQYNLINKAYQEATVEAFAIAIVEAYAQDEKCSGSAVATVGAGEKGDLNVATCKIDLDASTDYVVIDSLAAVIAEAGAKTCYGNVATDYYSIEAEAIAEAMALAVTEVSSSCFVVGKGYACAMGEADITKTATAVAAAFAKGYAEAASKCFGVCDTKLSALTKTIGKVLATAYSEIYFNKCIDKDYFIYDEVKPVLVKATAPAIAKIIAGAAVYAYGTCEVVVKPTVYIGETTTKPIPGAYLPKPTYPTPTHPAKPTYTKPHTPAYPSKPTYTKPHTPKGHPAKRGKGWKKGGRKGDFELIKKVGLRTRVKGGGSTYFRGKAVRKFTRRSKY